MHERVMVALDPRSPNRQAIEEAAVLAQSHEAELLIVVPYPMRQTYSERVTYDGTPFDQQYKVSNGSHAEEVAAQATLQARRFAGDTVRIRTRCEPGAPAAAVHELIDVLRPDLLVVGPSAHRSGSAFTQRVLRNLERKAHCDVLVVEQAQPLPVTAPVLAPGIDPQMA